MIVWKYSIIDNTNSVQNVCVLAMPRGAHILSVQTQGNTPTLWALVDPNEEQEPRYFQLTITGGSAPPSSVYLGTCQLYRGDFVQHVWELTDAD